MFKHLLIPLDGSPESAAALPPARALARALGASLQLLRVIPPRNPSRANEATRSLEAIRGELAGEPALSVDWTIREGMPAEEIARGASQEGADLIVMATHGRAGLDRLLHGSVAWQTLVASPVPLLLVRPGGHRLERLQTLLVPVDGSPGGALALGTAVGLARATGARVVVVEAVPPIPIDVYSGYWVGAVPYIDPGWDEEGLASAQRYVEGLAERLSRAGLQAEGVALLGAAPETIQQVANEVDADLVVMSTHALTGPARAVLGSTADAVVRGSHRPVLLIRQAAHREEPAA